MESSSSDDIPEISASRLPQFNVMDTMDRYFEIEQNKSLKEEDIEFGEVRTSKRRAQTKSKADYKRQNATVKK